MLAHLFITLFAIKFITVAATTSSSPCTTTLRQPPPPPFNCGVHGTLRHPAPITSKTISHSVTDPLVVCRTRCLDIDTGCISFSFDRTNNKCTTYSETLLKQGFERSSTPIVYFNKHCFGTVCPPCTTTSVATVTTGSVVSITSTDSTASVTTGVTTATSYSSTVTVTSFSTTITVTSFTTTSTSTQTISSGTTVISETSDVGLYRRQLEARKATSTPCVIVTSVVTVSSDSTTTVSVTATTDVEGSVTITTASTSTYVTDTTTTANSALTTTITTTVPAATQTNIATRTYEVVFGPTNGCAYTPNDFLDQYSQDGEYTHDEIAQICASFCDRTPGCVTFGMNNFPPCESNGYSIYCIASQDSYVSGSEECGIGTSFNGCSIYQDGTTFQLVG